MNNTMQMGEGNPLGVGNEDGTGNVDKIRDILFGGQMRDYDQRFRRLEETLLRESNEIREMTRQRLEALEAYVKREFEAQAQRLRAERDERNAAFQQAARELHEIHENLSRRLNEANDAASETSRSIREEILSRSTSLLQEMQARHRESNESLERHFSQLRNDKADRTSIAGLLNEMAMRLTGDFRLPDTPPEH
ncbi:hypothetical protein F183_A48440 [Bryobacterales bacterium F-183]|nr:hypothetical protein F183_A48440 [Bryobacterales bacterium F-183]